MVWTAISRGRPCHLHAGVRVRMRRGPTHVGSLRLVRLLCKLRDSEASSDRCRARSYRDRECQLGALPCFVWVKVQVQPPRPQPPGIGCLERASGQNSAQHDPLGLRVCRRLQEEFQAKLRQLQCIAMG
jgi:hypothetical protein